jgi:hypothetical protein
MPTRPRDGAAVFRDFFASLFGRRGSALCRLRSTSIQQGLSSMSPRIPSALPRTTVPVEGQFADPALPRTLTALRLARDFDLAPAGVALVMDLRDETGRLRARQRRG